MRLAKLSIKNFRSIKEIQNIRIEALQAFVGENNSGKSNILKAIDCFLTSGAGGIKARDFNDSAFPIIIEAEFKELLPSERKRLKSYLIGDQLILQKHLKIEKDDKTGKEKVESEYHGYKAEPQDWWLSIDKILALKGSRPKWEEIAEENGILEYVQVDDKVNKTTYTAGIEKYLIDHEIIFDTPVLGSTQALGLPQNLLSCLPEFYLLPAITDYSDEINKQSSSTVFRRLMGDLSDRIIKTDPRYHEIEDAINVLKKLLNSVSEGDGTTRLSALSSVEGTLTKIIAKLMPSVQGVELGVTIEEPKELFSRGVTLKVNDGVTTDVIDKGHGLQRSVIFGLLQMLMSTSRKMYDEEQQRPIILGIEEPELYIHPQCQRLIFNVLKEFSGSIDDENITGIDQVIYTTHSPAYVDVGNFERIAVAKKFDPSQGTIVQQCESTVFDSIDDKKLFKMLTSFSIKNNEMFFSRDIILVEGPMDEVALVATARKLGYINQLMEEMGVTIIQAGSKGEIPKLMRMMNAFDFNYGLLFELDGNDKSEQQNAHIVAEISSNSRVVEIPKTLETLVGQSKHFENVPHAKKFFANVENINDALEKVFVELLPKASKAKEPSAEKIPKAA